MPVNVTEQHGVTVIQVKGKFLGSLEGDDFKQTIDDLKAQGKTHVVVDLGETDFMDSTAIGVLISSLTSMRKAGGDVRLANLKKRIRSVFLMTKLLGGVFEDYESVEAAANSFETHPPAPATEED